MSILDHVRLAPLVIRVEPRIWEYDGLKHVVDVLYCFSPDVVSTAPGDGDIGLQEGILAEGGNLIDPSLTSPSQ